MFQKYALKIRAQAQAERWIIGPICAGVDHRRYLNEIPSSVRRTEPNQFSSSYYVLAVRHFDYVCVYIVDIIRRTEKRPTCKINTRIDISKVRSYKLVAHSGDGILCRPNAFIDFTNFIAGSHIINVPSQAWKRC